ncbi:MAG: isopeptide-forming domain-containing fimbrial protein [Patescibacteria group bacterium]
MFRKLVSNISFSPGLLNDLAFYAKRLHQEESIRRVGMIFMTLSLIIQSFALISPPQPSLASSMNDIVFGGTKTDDVLLAMEFGDSAGRKDIDDIYRHYGISDSDIRKTELVNLHHSDGNELFSIGRHQNTVNASLDRKVTVSTNEGGTTTFYERPLSIWGNKSFRAAKGTLTSGQQFWILLDGCGNIVMERGDSTPVNAKPELEILKTLESNNDTRVGSTVTYKIHYRNVGDAPAKDVVITDTLPSQLKYVSFSASGGVARDWTVNGNDLSWEFETVTPSSQQRYITIIATAQSATPGVGVCNQATINASNHGIITTSDARTGGCVDITSNTCPGTDIPIPSNGVIGCVVICDDGTPVSYTNTDSCPVTVVGCADGDAVNHTVGTTQNDSTLCRYVVCDDEWASNNGEIRSTNVEDCQYPSACTDESALNTSDNPKAISDNSLCRFQVVTGCTDDTKKNYSPLATEDDGSCQDYTYGCLSDPNADNYEPDVDRDNGSCQTKVPTLVCEKLSIVQKNTWDSLVFESVFDIKDGVTEPQLNYYIDGQLIQTTDLETDQAKHQLSRTFSEGEYKIEARLAAVYGDVQPTSACVLMIDIIEPEEPISIINESKTVSNTTQSLENADGTQAEGGDELVFTVTLSNSGMAAATNQPFVDDIHDLLEYAEVTDTGGAELDESERRLVWDNVDIEAESSVSRTFKVKVKNPIPTTPISTSDPLSYDMKITNTFGNTVTIELPRPAGKTVELAATTLPRTGPGTSISVGLVVFTLAGYMFARSRLLAHEADIIKANQAAGGV